MKARISLAEGPIGRHLVNLTIPMFLGISSMIVASMIDTVYVGWIGTLELAAVSFTFPVVMAMATLSMGIGVGAASIIARVVGAGDEEKVRRLSTDSLFLVAVLVVCLCGVGWLFVEPLFTLLGARAEILPLSISYMNIWLIGLPAFALPMVATNIMRAVGNARLPGIIMAGGAALQVLIAPALIFGIPGYTDGLGITGAAWSFVLSRLLMFGYTVRVLIRMQLLSFSVEAFHVHWASWKEIMKIGLPSMASNLIGPISMGVIVALLAGYGHEVVAGFGVASRIESLATMIVMAVSASTGPFIGQNWGARQYDRIYRAQSLGFRFSYLWSLFAFVVLAGGGRFLVGLINDDPGVIDATYAYLLLIPATYGFLGVGAVAGSTFIALGKPMPTLILSMLRMVVLFIPLALLMDGWFGYRGIFGAAAICNIVLGVLSFGWVRSMLRKEIVRHGPAREVA
ncbi:MAG: MATE family efflux transporter [Gammaproteobacteria bacterium]|nr:MATE family efflux transporter [Gammaproteobacteria bacterium]